MCFFCLACFFRHFFLFYMKGCFVYTYTYVACVSPWKPEEGTKSLELEYRLLLAIVPVLVMEPGSSARAGGALNSGTISPAPDIPIFANYHKNFFDTFNIFTSD